MNSNSYNINLYQTLVKLHVEYAIVVRSVCRKMCPDNVEKVQLRATKLIQKIRHLTYDEILDIL
jgi:hypothetical protein